LVGLNLKQELPLFNARLRSSFLRDQSNISNIGSTSYSGFPISTLGLGINELEAFIEGRHSLCASFAAATKPKLVFSSELFDSVQGLYFLSLLDLLSKKVPKLVSKNISVVNLQAVSVGSCESGRSIYSGSKSSKFKTLVFIDVDPSEDLSTDALSVLISNSSSNVYSLSFSA